MTTQTGVKGWVYFVMGGLLVGEECRFMSTLFGEEGWLVDGWLIGGGRGRLG